MVDVPGDALATGTSNVQMAKSANDTPVTTIDVAPTAAVTVPVPQFLVYAPDTVTPAGRAKG
jgi:hypothetical protein